MKLSDLTPPEQSTSLAQGPTPTNSEPAPKKKPKKRKRSLLVRLFLWCTSLLTTMLVLGVAAVVATYSWVSRDLPDLDKILEFKAPQATIIYARDGSVLGTLCHEKRYVITLDDMPKYLPMSFLAIEDTSFYEHLGINPLAILRAFLINFERGTKSQGGSTITQQIIKQMLLSSERSYIRKMKEAILATKLERALSKDQILSLYLNYIYLGQHAYGVEAAARTYFGKHAADLTLAEAALIAGMPQAPSRYNPYRKPKVAKQRQMEVLGRLRTLKWITEEEYQKAANEPLVYWSEQEQILGPSQWYFEEARRLLIEFFSPETLKALGVEEGRSGEDYVYEAGLTVQTSMEPFQQNLAGYALREGLESLDKRQGWRGPVKNLATQAERDEFLSKKHFDPEDLLGGQWTQALVTSSNGKEVRLALGDGWTGVLAPGSMSWAASRSPLAPKNLRKGIVVAGDVIWVNQKASPPSSKDKNSASAKDKNARSKDKAKDAAKDKEQKAPSKDRPLVLQLQQEPLVQGAIVSIEPQTGDVVALIGGYQFGDSHFNRATQARRQPGSSFKPIVYSAALDNGFTPASSVLDAPVEYVTGGKVWRPSNFENNYRGIMPLHQALALSRNTTTVRVAHAVGVDKIIQRAKDLGLEPDFPRVLPICLGAVAVSPLNLTQAYAAFANNGLGVRPRIITSIKDNKGKELYRQDVEHWQAISPQTAYQMDLLLEGVVNHGTGTRARIDGRHVAGKTGTTNDTHDVWFMGFTPYLVTGVYVGYDQLHSLGRAEQGGRTAAPIFRAYRSKADVAYDSAPQNFSCPEGIVVSGGQAYKGSVDSGISATDGRSSEATPGFSPSGPDTSREHESLMEEMF